MAVNGRAKGQVFERELARTISVWWTGNKALEKVRAEELPFRRTPLSGGWDRKAAASDLLVVDPTALPVPWPFALEAKNQECWNWDGLFKSNDKWPVKAYWDQCCEAAEKSKLTPLVLFTRKLQPIYFAMDPSAAMRIGLCDKIITVGWLPFAIGKFDDLLALDPQQFVALITEGPTQISASFQQAKGGAKPVANPVQERPIETRDRPASRVLGGEPERLSPRVFVREYGDLPLDRVEELEREREERAIPTKRPMMLKNFHGKWKKVPVPVKDWKPADETKVIPQYTVPSTARRSADKNGNWV